MSQNCQISILDKIYKKVYNISRKGARNDRRFRSSFCSLGYHFRFLNDTRPASRFRAVDRSGVENDRKVYLASVRSLLPMGVAPLSAVHFGFGNRCVAYPLCFGPSSVKLGGGLFLFNL